MKHKVINAMNGIVVSVWIIGATVVIGGAMFAIHMLLKVVK